jgi:hypothetical protein
MAYDRAEIEKQAINAIKTNQDIVFIQDVISVLPCASSTFYLWELDKSENIKDALQLNRVRAKREMRSSWKNNQENATLQLALYKLLSDTEERDALTMQKTDVTTQGEKIGAVTVEIIHTAKDSSD